MGDTLLYVVVARPC